jgi:hypothetical protein
MEASCPSGLSDNKNWTHPVKNNSKLIHFLAIIADSRSS